MKILNRRAASFAWSLPTLLCKKLNCRSHCDRNSALGLKGTDGGRGGKPADWVAKAMRDLWPPSTSSTVYYFPIRRGVQRSTSRAFGTHTKEAMNDFSPSLLRQRRQPMKWKKMTFLLPRKGHNKNEMGLPNCFSRSTFGFVDELWKEEQQCLPEELVLEPF